MRFKDWILENIVPYEVMGPGIDGTGDPARTPDTINTKLYGKGEVKDKAKVKMANFVRNKTIKRK